MFSVGHVVYSGNLRNWKPSDGVRLRALQPKIANSSERYSTVANSLYYIGSWCLIKYKGIAIVMDIIAASLHPDLWWYSVPTQQWDCISIWNQTVSEKTVSSTWDRLKKLINVERRQNLRLRLKNGAVNTNSVIKNRIIFLTNRTWLMAQLLFMSHEAKRAYLLGTTNIDQALQRLNTTH